MYETTQQEIDRLKESLGKAKQLIVKQDATLRRLASPPFTLGTVIDIRERENPNPEDFIVGRSVTLRQSGEGGGIGKIVQHLSRGVVGVVWQNGVTGRYRIGVPDVQNGARDLDLKGKTYNAIIQVGERLIEAIVPPGYQIKPGQLARLTLESMQIVAVSDYNYSGEIATIRSVTDDKFCEIDYQGTIRQISVGSHSGGVNKGDRVVVDSSVSIILHNLGRNEAKFVINEPTNIRWSDIGGLKEVKKELIEAIELPYRYKDKYARYGKKPVKGVLIYGPPGCGKTMLGKAAASAQAEIHHAEAVGSGFLYIKGPEILEKYVGVAEATVRSLFQTAREHKKQYGYPAVIFIDEAEAILNRRGSGVSSDVERTVVPAFLTEMSGFDDSGAIVILATNRPELLDSAIIRYGRIDRRIRVPRPSQDEVKEIFSIYFDKLPLAEGISAQLMAEMGTAAIFSEACRIYEILMRDGSKLDLRLGQIASGAMVETLVDRASSNAIYREVQSNREVGVCRDDLIKAIGSIFQEALDMEHPEDLEAFIHNFKDDVVDIKKMTLSA